MTRGWETCEAIVEACCNAWRGPIAKLAVIALIGAYVVDGAVFLAILAFRVRRATARRPFRLKYIWVLPAIFLILTTLAARPPQGMQAAWLAVVLAVGLGIGWVSGAPSIWRLIPRRRRCGPRPRRSPWCAR